MSKETPAGELSDEQIDELQRARNAAYHAGELTDHRSYARAIIAADRELRRGDASTEGGTLEENVNYLLGQCPHAVRDMSGERTGSRAVEDLSGSIAITFLGLQKKLADAQAALAAQALEIEGLRKDAERYRFLRDSPIDGRPGQPVIAVPNDASSGDYVNEETADAAVDAAIEAMSEEKAK